MPDKVLTLWTAILLVSTLLSAIHQSDIFQSLSLLLFWYQFMISVKFVAEIMYAFFFSFFLVKDYVCSYNAHKSYLIWASRICTTVFLIRNKILSLLLLKLLMNKIKLPFPLIFKSLRHYVSFWFIFKKCTIVLRRMKKNIKTVIFIPSNITEIYSEKWLISTCVMPKERRNKWPLLIVHHDWYILIN